jgi:hypothetical protein
MTAARRSPSWPPRSAASPATSPSDYEARDVPGRFYLYEVYARLGAFGEHLQTQSVHDFIAAIPTLSTTTPGSLV